MGLDIYLYDKRDKDERQKDVPSKQHPDHLCNRRYLRSSYNEGGFNTVMRNLGLPDLYAIFQPPQNGDIGEPGPEIETVSTGDEDWPFSYYWTPSPATLFAARERAVRAVELLRNMRFLRATRLMALGMSPAKDGQEAIERYKKEIADAKHDFGSWSSRNGTFFRKPFEILGAVEGHMETFLIYEDPENHAHYVATCEIIVEFIDEALALGTNARHSWSG